MTEMNDGLQNLVANIGTGRDKSAHSVYVAEPLDDSQLIAMYRTSWAARKIVDIPAFDACRAWRDWQAKPEQITAIEAVEAKHDVRGKVSQALIRSRLLGGAAIYIGTDDADPSTPLDPSRVGKDGLKHLTVLSKRYLQPDELEDNPLSPEFGHPRRYILSGGSTSVEIHPSRLVVMRGRDLPDPEFSIQGWGWGDSALLSVRDALTQNDQTFANVASLVFEAKVDVMRLPDLMESLAHPEYEARLSKRLNLANVAKGINGTLIMDALEEYESKSHSFGTLPDIMDRFLQAVAGAADIPTTRLLGQSPAGMNATGESDLINYYDRISADQEMRLRPAMRVLDECIVRSALGSYPPEIHYRWGSLWQVSAKERAEIGKMNAESAAKLHGTGLIEDKALAEAVVNQAVEDGFYPGLESMTEGEADA